MYIVHHGSNYIMLCLRVTLYLFCLYAHIKHQYSYIAQADLHIKCPFSHNITKYSVWENSYRRRRRRFGVQFTYIIADGISFYIGRHIARTHNGYGELCETFPPYTIHYTYICMLSGCIFCLLCDINTIQTAMTFISNTTTLHST